MIIDILQQPPFRFVDDLVDYADNTIRCNYIVKADSPMLVSGKLSAEGLIECMAQTSAVKSALDNPNEPANTGYLVSVKNFEFSGDLAVGEEVIMQLELVQKLMQFSIFNAKAFAKNKLIAQCEMRTFDTSK